MVDEHTIADSDALTGTGALATASALPGGDDADTYFGGFGRFCSAGDIGIVVFDDVAIVGE
jgi:hypothetical protein